MNSPSLIKNLSEKRLLSPLLSIELGFGKMKIIRLFLLGQRNKLLSSSKVKQSFLEVGKLVLAMTISSFGCGTRILQIDSGPQLNKLRLFEQKLGEEIK
jgi:hypothetical protein